MAHSVRRTIPILDMNQHIRMTLSRWSYGSTVFMLDEPSPRLGSRPHTDTGYSVRTISDFEGCIDSLRSGGGQVEDSFVLHTSNQFWVAAICARTLPVRSPLANSTALLALAFGGSLRVGGLSPGLYYVATDRGPEKDQAIVLSKESEVVLTTRLFQRRIRPSSALPTTMGHMADVYISDDCVCFMERRYERTTPGSEMVFENRFFIDAKWAMTEPGDRAS